jgi:small subunit ribosomal protein S16
MVRIRLRRVGAKKQPSYRVVVADQRAPRDGKFVEAIGHYNPRTEPITFQIDEERALYWLSQGAQSSEPVERLLRKGGTLDRFARLRAGEPLETLLAEAKQKLEVEAREVAEEVREEVVKSETERAEAEEEEEERSMAEEAVAAWATGEFELVEEAEGSEESGGLGS